MRLWVANGNNSPCPLPVGVANTTTNCMVMLLRINYMKSRLRSGLLVINQCNGFLVTYTVFLLVHPHKWFDKLVVHFKALYDKDLVIDCLRDMSAHQKKRKCCCPTWWICTTVSIAEEQNALVNYNTAIVRDAD